MEDSSQIDNEPQTEKAGTYFCRRNLLLAVGVIAASVFMGLVGRNQQRCGCLPFGVSSTKCEGLGRSGLPRLLDLGATTCVPCKMMASILDELKEEYAGRFHVEFVDVWVNRDAAAQYGVESIPTQIFFDVSGKEIYRHQGFISKDEILKKWHELGVNLAN